MTETRAGQLRDRITVQSRSTAIGSRGQSTEVWSDVGVPVWAEVKHLSGGELEQARKIVATATTQIRMRKPRSYTLTTEHRITHRGETYNIGSAPPDGEDHEDLILTCTREV